MEGLLISAFVTTLGYYLKDSVRKKDIDISKNEIPSPQDIYHSDKVNEVNEEILQKSTDNYKKSQTPITSGIIPSLFNTYGSINNNKLMTETKMSNIQEKTYGNFSNDLEIKKATIEEKPMFRPGTNSFEISTQLPFSDIIQTSSNINPLTGLEYQKDHSNMTPFFGGSIKQNVESFSNVSTLDTYTGTRSYRPPKKEVESFFNLEKENIYGAPVFSSTIDTSRFIASQFKQGEKPFLDEKIAAPIAGTFENPLNKNFQKTVDELRIASNPKTSYEGRVKEGQKGSVRGIVGAMNKNTPDMSFPITNDMLFNGPGAVSAHSMQKNYNDNFKNTNRQDSASEYFGIGNSGVKENYKQGLVQDTIRNQLSTDTRLNIKGIDTYRNNTENLIDACNLVKQERETTYNAFDYKTIQGNSLPTIHNKYDLKNTKRQDYLSNCDNSGNLQSRIKIFNNVIDNPKQTLKEVNLVKDYKGIKKGNEYFTTSRDKYDNVEILTIKETLHTPRQTQMGSSGLGNIGTEKDNLGTVDKWKRPIHEDCVIDRTPDIFPTNNVIISKKNIGLVNLETKKNLIPSRIG